MSITFIPDTSFEQQDVSLFQTSETLAKESNFFNKSYASRISIAQRNSEFTHWIIDQIVLVNEVKNPELENRFIQLQNDTSLLNNGKKCSVVAAMVMAVFLVVFPNVFSKTNTRTLLTFGFIFSALALATYLERKEYLQENQLETLLNNTTVAKVASARNATYSKELWDKKLKSVDFLHPYERMEQLYIPKMKKWVEQLNNLFVPKQKKSIDLHEFYDLFSKLNIGTAQFAQDGSYKEVLAKFGSYRGHYHPIALRLESSMVALDKLFYLSQRCDHKLGQLSFALRLLKREIGGQIDFLASHRLLEASKFLEDSEFEEQEKIQLYKEYQELIVSKQQKMLDCQQRMTKELTITKQKALEFLHGAFFETLKEDIQNLCHHIQAALQNEPMEEKVDLDSIQAKGLEIKKTIHFMVKPGFERFEELLQFDFPTLESRLKIRKDKNPES